MCLQEAALLLGVPKVVGRCWTPGCMGEWEKEHTWRYPHGSEGKKGQQLEHKTRVIVEVGAESTPQSALQSYIFVRVMSAAGAAGRRRRIRCWMRCRCRCVLFPNLSCRSASWRSKTRG